MIPPGESKSFFFANSSPMTLAKKSSRICVSVPSGKEIHLVYVAVAGLLLSEVNAA